jgi:hypothetical protein
MQPQLEREVSWRDGYLGDLLPGWSAAPDEVGSLIYGLLNIDVSTHSVACTQVTFLIVNRLIYRMTMTSSRFRCLLVAEGAAAVSAAR